MEDAKEYTEMVLNDIGEQYDIDSEELIEKYMFDEKNIDEENKEPEILFSIIIINEKEFFRDKYGNIYNQDFKYIEKEENNRKRQKKEKKIKITKHN